MNKVLSRRDFFKSSVLIGGLSICSSLIAACGGGSGAPTAVAETGKTFTFDLSAGDTVEFSTKTLEADAGSKITLTFTNKSTDKLFNWVLAKPGQMLRVVTNASSESEATGYLREGDDNVIVHTKLLKAGESDTITFDAPAPGSYQFFSTFPGYYTRMNGTLTIK